MVFKNKKQEEYYNKNKNHILEKMHERRLNNIDQYLEYNRKYRLKHKEKMNKQMNLIHKKIIMKVIDHYSHGTNKCSCCNESIFVFLTIDHTNNDGAKHRKDIGMRAGIHTYRWLIKTNFPEGYQVMCMNCNWGKWRNKGICPHKLL